MPVADGVGKLALEMVMHRREEIEFEVVKAHLLEIHQDGHAFAPDDPTTAKRRDKRCRHGKIVPVTS